MAEGKVIIADQTLQGNTSSVEFIDIDPSGYTALELIVNCRSNGSSGFHALLKVTLGTDSGYLSSQGNYVWNHLQYFSSSNSTQSGAYSGYNASLTNSMQLIFTPNDYQIPNDELDNRGCYGKILFTGVQQNYYTTCVGRSGFLRGRGGQTYGSGFGIANGTVINNNDATTKIKLQYEDGSSFTSPTGQASFMLVGWTDS